MGTVNEMKKLPFYTMFYRPETISATSGTEFDKTYNVFVDEKGKKKLRCTGETNRDAKIQAHKDECLVENILAKATLDPSVLNKTSGMYFDTTTLPKTLAEAQNAIIQIQGEFDKLDAETKLKFDNSVEKYVMQYGTLPWAEALGRIKKDTQKLSEEKTVEEEAKNAE